MKLPIIALAALLSAAAAGPAAAATAADVAPRMEDAGAGAARFGAVARALAASKAKADPSAVLAQTPPKVDEAPLASAAKPAEKPAEKAAEKPAAAADAADDAKPGARAADAKTAPKAGAAAVAKAPEPKSRPIVVRWWPDGRPVPSYGRMDDFDGIEPRLEAARRTLDDSSRFPARKR